MIVAAIQAQLSPGLLTELAHKGSTTMENGRRHSHSDLELPCANFSLIFYGQNFGEDSLEFQGFQEM